MLFFPEINGKTLGLTWSKKSCSYRATQAQAQPAGQTVAARAWGAISSSKPFET